MSIQQLSLPTIKPGYRSQASDTCLETDIFEFALLRQRSNSDRLQMSTILTKGARQLCVGGLQPTHHLAQQAEALRLTSMLMQAMTEAGLSVPVEITVIPQTLALTPTPLPLWERGF